MKTFPPERWMSQADGDVTCHRQGPDLHATTVQLPWTLVTSASFMALANLSSLRSLSLSGIHFPTTQVTRDDLESLAASGMLHTLSLHGAYLPEDVLKSVCGTLELEEIDLRSLSIAERSAVELLASQTRLQSVSLGHRPPGPFHRFVTRPFGPEVLTAIDNQKDIQVARIRGCRASDEQLSQASFLAQVVELDIGETAAGPKTFSRIGENSGAKVVVADRSGADDTSLKAVGGLERLRVLDVGQTRVTMESLDSLRSASGLVKLGLAGIPIDGTGAEVLASFTGLRELNLSGTGIGAAALRRIASPLAQLRRLDLNRVQSGAGELEALHLFPRLEEVSVSISEPGHVVWEILAELKSVTEVEGRLPASAGIAVPTRLRSLLLRGEPSASVLSKLLEANPIEQLQLQSNANALGAAGHASLPHLRELFATNAGMSDAALRVIAESSRLEAVYVSDSSITDAGLTSLTQAQFVHTLEFRNTLITDASVEVLRSLGRLHCLDVPGTRITDVGVARLAAAANLQSLALDARQITPISIRALEAAPVLVEIYIYGPLQTDTLERIAKLSGLRELNIMDAMLEVDAAEHIAALPHLHVLRHWGGATAELWGVLGRSRPEVIMEGPVSGPPIRNRFDAASHRSLPTSTAFRARR